VLRLPEGLCLARSQARPGRPVSRQVVESQMDDLENSLPGLGKEGFEIVYVLGTQEEVDRASLAM
jgi:protein phosphatase